MSHYHAVMAYQIVDRRGNTPLDCEAEHDFVLLTVARANQRVAGAIKRAVANLEKEVREAEAREEFALAVSHDEDSWRSAEGPETVTQGASLRSLLAAAKILDGQPDREWSMRHELGFLSFATLAQVMTYA